MTTSETHTSDDLNETRTELARLAVVLVAGLVAAGMTYLVPALARFRPWVEGEGVPVVRLFEEAQAAPSFAEPGDVAAPTGSSSHAHGAAQRLLDAERTHTRPPKEAHAGGPALQIDPSEYEGLTQSIEFPGALDAFFRRLERTARGEPKAVTRIAHYGDSAVAADEITRTARALLQERFGDAGHGFILISRGDMHYLHRDIRHRASDDWETFSVVRKELGVDWYGYGGVQARGGPGASATFATVEEGTIGTRVSRFELFYQRHRGGGSVQLEVDRDRREPIDTRADTQEDGWAAVEVPDGPHALTVRVRGGQARLYGVALEREGPGVVYDSLGLVGAVAERLLSSERAHAQRQIAHRAPDLLVLGFGGNESVNAWIKIPAYEEELIRVVRHVRGDRPEMSCLLFGPLDQARRDERGRITTVPNLKEIVEVQRRVAQAQGCAFFDTYAAMGGEGAMFEWYRSRPRLATSDFRHATPKGYEVIGSLYVKALLQAFARHLERSR